MDEVHRARHGGKGAELAYLLGPPPSQNSNTFTSPDSVQLHQLVGFMELPFSRHNGLNLSF